MKKTNSKQNKLVRIALIFSVLQSCFLPLIAQQSDLSARYLRTEYKENPVTDVLHPRLSWELESKERRQLQTAYQIMVSSSGQLLKLDKGDLWDSGRILSDRTNQVEYKGSEVVSRKVYYWKVRSWDKNNIVGKWSPVAKWEMGLLNKPDWKASWIGNDLSALGKGSAYHLPPAPYFRKQVKLNKSVKKARLYVTALGLYEFYVNGQRIGKDNFTPGWTDYHKRVYYQVYDVTDKLKAGNNILSSIVADGWYSGYLGYALLVNNPVVRNFYGKVPLLKAQMEVEYEDGTHTAVVTDASWKSNHGPMVEADILNGETYDARLEFTGWNTASYVAEHWKNATVFPDQGGRSLESYPGNTVQVFKEIKALSVTKRTNGKYIFNLGQNFSGNVRLKVKGKRGDTITLKYGEVLFPNGDLMTENLRKARATDTYILKGDLNGEVYTPRFTYHGFQYVEVSGFRTQPAVNAVTGIVLSSATPVVGSFTTDQAMVNKLYSNIVWTQRSNYFDIPTDCPQRDERLGWTGDAQTYMQSATFNADISAFFTKWLVDLNDAQRIDHTYPIYAPAPNIRITDTYSPGWSEAGIICPYTLYKVYGDVRVIRKFWVNMTDYLQFLETKSKGTFVFKEASFEDISPKGGFGDWLSAGKKTPPDMLATIYYGYIASMMSEMANAIGKHEDEIKYREISNQIKSAFLKHYMAPEGRFKTNVTAYGNGEGYVDGEMGFDGHTQTAYANAIYMNMLTPDQAHKAGDFLSELIHQNSGRLATGFLGVKPLLPALSKTGHTDQAYQLLLNVEYPSWGFEIVNGANTIWERWNSYIKGKGFENNAGMNSFNHYAFGSVNEWLFGNSAGIRTIDPGYRKFLIRPEIAKDGIGLVKASYHSINGQILSAWKRTDQGIAIDIAIPVNTTADVFIPANNENDVKEGKHRVNIHPDMKVKGLVDGFVHLELGSGVYHFSAR